MKKINVAIVGYGNLGKAMECALLNNGAFNLVKIFSRRKNLKSPFNTGFELLQNILDYKNKIDVLFLCCGSYDDVLSIAPNLLKDFNTVDSFDTHAKLFNYINIMQKIATQDNKVAICAGGWDPGLLSLMRLIFYSISPNSNMPISFWGKGVSQGHSNAIKNISGVKNALQYTIPNKALIKKCNKKIVKTPTEFEKHFRLCYVSTHKNANKKHIKTQIINMPNYFKGYKTKVKFVSNKTILKKQKKMFHKGLVIKNFSCANGFKARLNFSLDVKSNPGFTAEVLLSLGIACYKLSIKKDYGAYSVFDLPVKYLTTLPLSTLYKKFL